MRAKRETFSIKFLTVKQQIFSQKKILSSLLVVSSKCNFLISFRSKKALFHGGDEKHHRPAWLLCKSEKFVHLCMEKKARILRGMPNSFISLVEKPRIPNDLMNGTCHSSKPHGSGHCPVVDCFSCFSVLRFSPPELLFRNKFIEIQS